MNQQKLFVWWFAALLLVAGAAFAQTTSTLTGTATINVRLV